MNQILTPRNKNRPFLCVGGPRQLIVNSQKAAVTTLWGDRKQKTELSKREKWLVPVSTIQRK